MELTEYIKTVEEKEIFTLEKQLVESRDRLSFLVDYASFSPAEMRLNSSSFQWHERMPEIFAEHKQIVEEKTGQYQDGLKVGSIFSGMLQQLFAMILLVSCCNINEYICDILVLLLALLPKNIKYRACTELFPLHLRNYTCAIQVFYPTSILKCIVKRSDVDVH